MLRKIRLQYIKQYFLILLSIVIIFIAFLLFFYSLRPEILVKSQSYKTASEYAENIVRLCSDQQKWKECYGNQLAQINYQLTLPKTVEILQEIKKKDLRARDCHIMAHDISNSEVEKAPQDWIKIFDYVDQTTCNNGFVHGVMEGRRRFDPSLELNGKTIPETCRLIEERTSKRVDISRGVADDACLHVVGHILLTESNGVIKDAIRICESIAPNVRRSCFEGVFMENITKENLEAHEVVKRFELTESVALEELCDQFEGDVRRSCWRELAHVYTELTKHDPSKVYKLCYKEGNVDFAQECYFHAINSMIISDGFSSEKLKNVCKNYWGEEEGEQVCIVRSLMPLLGSSIEFMDSASEFCNYQQSQEFCYIQIGVLLKPRTNPEKQEELCNRVPKDFFSLCNQRN